MRLFIGGLVEGAGLLLVVFAAQGMIEGLWPWVVGGAAALGGVIMILEGTLGWCVVRAMGVKTPV